MEQTIIGSTAIKHWFPHFNRIPKDLDYAVDEDYSGKKVQDVEYLYNPHLDFSQVYATPETLLSLKISHLFWETNWDKHMWDTQFLLKEGVKPDYSLINTLIPFWEEYLPKIRRSVLEMSKEVFFNNNVNKDVDEHDNLHRQLVEVPAYTKILKDGCDVELDFSKWEKLSEQEKRDVVNEETYVMAFERYEGKIDLVRGFRRQLKSNIMKHFPKPIAFYAIENFTSFQNPPKEYKLK